MIAAIVAVGRNGVIGKDNALPWHLPQDLKYFKELTTDNIVIMGRKTYESIGHALPNRINIVMTRDKNYQPNEHGVYVANDYIQAGALINQWKSQGYHTYIIGGEQIFRNLLPLVGTVFVTRIDHDFEGDAYMPSLDPMVWEKVSSVKGPKNEQNPYDYYFEVYRRRGAYD